MRRIDSGLAKDALVYGVSAAFATWLFLTSGFVTFHLWSRYAAPTYGGAAVIAAVGLGSAAARAQDKTPTAAAPIARTPVMPKMPAMPRPGPEVEKLSYFVGAWSSTGHIKPSPLGEGGDTKGRESCGWLPGKFFVGCMMLSESPMGRIQT